MSDETRATSGARCPASPHRLDDGVQCGACPRACWLPEGPARVMLAKILSDHGAYPIIARSRHIDPPFGAAPRRSLSPVRPHIPIALSLRCVVCRAQRTFGRGICGAWGIHVTGLAQLRGLPWEGPIWPS